MMISFKVSYEEAKLVTKIAARADKEVFQDLGIEWDVLNIEMDLCATIANGCPLYLENLLRAPDYDFAHDMLGIFWYLNRNTGKLENCFLPRFANLEKANG